MNDSATKPKSQILPEDPYPGDPYTVSPITMTLIHALQTILFLRRAGRDAEGRQAKTIEHLIDAELEISRRIERLQDGGLKHVSALIPALLKKLEVARELSGVAR